MNEFFLNKKRLQREWEKNRQLNGWKMKTFISTDWNRTNIRRDGSSRYQNKNIAPATPLPLPLPLPMQTQLIKRVKCDFLSKAHKTRSLRKSLFAFLYLFACRIKWQRSNRIKKKKGNYNSWSLFLSQSAAWLHSERGKNWARIKTTTNERSSSYQKHNLRQNSLQNVHTMVKMKENKNGNKNTERQNGNWTKMRHRQQFQFCNEQTVGPNRYSIWSHHCGKKCHSFFCRKW